ncbi:hypothetical protein IRJ41_011504 [Triplophysa rosa]|uniref:Reverse transcriptase domain-containing protein n=1 Tax=Triplophysa rosa TaxID=992332 RepID=A0A9W7WIG4_TRIRA|nr:hypothetical protein IRJ41_011504 [Triplophysa rosa]
MGMEGERNDVVPQEQNIVQRECDILGRNFASVWNSASHTSLSEEEVTHKLSNCSVPPLSIGQVKARLRKVNATKAAGPDCVPSRVLKTFHEELASVLCDIFNTCIQHNIFPQQWKEAIVKAVPKKAKPCFPADYRQISLLSCVGNGILRDAILEDTVTKIEPSQHGFMRNRSTDTALIQVLQHCLDSHLPPSVIPVKYADDLTITEFLIGSLPGLTQKALDSVVEWGQEFTLVLNGAKTVDMIKAEWVLKGDVDPTGQSNNQCAGLEGHGNLGEDAQE